MPGTRDPNLRSGHLAEDLGVLLLRRIAAVAVVRHQDDVGVDAVCTLLVSETYVTKPKKKGTSKKPQRRRRLVAKESCYVQIKAVSEEVIPYSVDELKWLGALELPFFFASVDQDRGSVSVYSLNAAEEQTWGAAFVNPQHEVRFHLGPRPPQGADAGKPYWELYLGKPALEWSLTSLDEELELVVVAFREWSRKQLQNVSLRPRGACNVLGWKTNEMPSPAAEIGGSNTFEALAAIDGPVQTLALHCIATKSVEGWRVFRPVLHILDQNADALHERAHRPRTLPPDRRVDRFDRLARDYHKDNGAWLTEASSPKGSSPKG